MPQIDQDECYMCTNPPCAEVCPVNAIYRGEQAMYIEQDECIDCGACEIECPINAIN